MNTDTQDNVTLNLCSNSALPQLQTLLHCHELYPIITLNVILCNWMPVALNVPVIKHDTSHA